ncbi:DUF7520 family protein [Halosolutus gelatinilyticus]|uniref:DUF7520 family protein n=1 Tax=Halosolutus gelatinilyticus TaxID=2931975 RepID=UPI001FF1B882|nr:hypothetical protein [Halosolutus gelatinilyticus]
MTDRTDDSGRSTARTEEDRDDRRTVVGSRVVVAFGLVLVAVTAAFGAVLGRVLPARTGVEETVLLGITVPVSPAAFALYGAVTVGIATGAVVLLLRLVARFDENAA